MTSTLLEEVVFNAGFKFSQKGGRKAPPIKEEVGGEWAELFPASVCRWEESLSAAVRHMAVTRWHGPQSSSPREKYHANVRARSSTPSQCCFHTSTALTSVFSLFFVHIHNFLIHQGHPTANKTNPLSISASLDFLTTHWTMISS